VITINEEVFGCHVLNRESRGATSQSGSGPAAVTGTKAEGATGTQVPGRPASRMIGSQKTCLETIGLRDLGLGVRIIITKSPIPNH